MGYNFRDITVMIIDDSRFQRALLRSIMTSFSFGTILEMDNVVTAEGVLRERTSKPDLVLLDQRMEPIDGLTYAQRIRSNDAHPLHTVPIIMVTAHADLDTVKAARNAGVTEFLVKPVSAQALMARILSVVERPRPFVRTKTFFGPCRRRQSLEEYAGPLRRRDDQAEDHSHDLVIADDADDLTWSSEDEASVAAANDAIDAFLQQLDQEARP